VVAPGVAVNPGLPLVLYKVQLPSHPVTSVTLHIIHGKIVMYLGAKDKAQMPISSFKDSNDHLHYYAVMASISQLTDLKGDDAFLGGLFHHCRGVL
jgi:hypothetical protein